jgi:hypothetical protein
MCPPLVGSDYYEGSATPEHHQLTASLPTLVGGVGRFPRSPLADRRGRCPAESRQPRHRYAAALPDGLLLGPVLRGRSRPPAPAGGRALQARPISARLEPVVNLRDVNTGSSRTPARLACRTRAVWQCRPVPSLSGLLPPSLAPPRQGCPRLHRPAATSRRWSPCTSTRSNGTSWRTTGFDDSSLLGERDDRRRNLVAHQGERYIARVAQPFDGVDAAALGDAEGGAVLSKAFTSMNDSTLVCDSRPAMVRSS